MSIGVAQRNSMQVTLPLSYLGCVQVATVYPSQESTGPYLYTLKTFQVKLKVIELLSSLFAPKWNEYDHPISHT